MRTNVQGQKIACSKCQRGHRTSQCVDAPGHQDDVRVVHRSGRPRGSKTNPVRAAEGREKKSRRLVDKLQKKQDAASRVYDLPRAASEPMQRGFVTGNPQVPVQGYQNLGNLTGPQDPAPSAGRRFTFPADPHPAGLYGSIPRSFEQPVNPGMGQRSALPAPADSVPVSTPPTLGFPVTAHGNAIPGVSHGVDNFSDIGFGMGIPNPLDPSAPSPGSGAMSNSLYSGFHDSMPAPGHTSLRPSRHAFSAPVSLPVLLNQFGAMTQNSSVNNAATAFPQVDVIAQVDQVDTRMFQIIQESAMEAADVARPVLSTPFPDLSPRNEEVQETVSWDGLIPEQVEVVQPMPAATAEVQFSGSPSSFNSWLDVSQSHDFRWELRRGISRTWYSG